MGRKLKFCILVTMLLSLSGCALRSGDELLVAPQPTKNYQALQTELKKELDTGDVIYASPESGENRSTVQLKDLDNDGEDEAIAFFRGSQQRTSNKFTVIVYKKIGDLYLKMGTATGSGSAILSVDYPMFTEDGQRGIVIAWKLTTADGGTGLTVCGFEGSSRVVTLLETDYLAFALSDMMKQGKQELVTINADTAGRKVARLYAYEGDEMKRMGEAALSADVKTIVRLTQGYAAEQQPAIFVEEKTESGVGLMTDILTFNSVSGLRNIAPGNGQNVLYSTYRPVSVNVADANGDGILEIPRASLMAGFDGSSTDALYLLDWYAYGGVTPQLMCTTYNSQSEEWQLTVPASWRDTVTVSRTSSLTGLNCTTFEVYVPGGVNVPLLSIYTLTGDLRTYLADNSSTKMLSKTNSAIYTASIPPEAAGNPLALTMEGVEQRFTLISQSWAS